MVTIQMNQNQAKQIAEAIFKDIENYIQTHQEEYNKFLKEKTEEQEGGER